MKMELCGFNVSVSFSSHIPCTVGSMRAKRQVETLYGSTLYLRWGKLEIICNLEEKQKDRRVYPFTFVGNQLYCLQPELTYWPNVTRVPPFLLPFASGQPFVLGLSPTQV